ncbi:MAG: N6-L-threonylcarbamoyladenine synthase [Candidatus Midichloriaceae bacterium]|jgi:N6-L-threonylcarbamoyladenine synthase
MIVLGIETSCDETAVAIVDENKKIFANKIFSQIDLHKKFGGVVPEIAARSHVEILPQLIEDALSEAKLSISDIDAFAATGGPGLIGGVMVGVMYAKTLSSIQKKPFIAINHLEGHALTIRLVSDINYPYLLLLISGGHCQIIAVEGLGKYKILGRTLDDAVGEAFDKVAKMLDLGYPGGPIVEKYAKLGDKKAYKFPKPLPNTSDFSFSGLKTSVRNQIHKIKDISEKDKRDICASFQYTVSEILINKLRYSVKNLPMGYDNIVIAGGVAANLYIRNRVSDEMGEIGYKVLYSPVDLCTDNAAMIAWTAIERLQQGDKSDLGFKPKSRWNMNEIIY